jgi:hypothetical protein
MRIGYHPRLKAEGMVDIDEKKLRCRSEESLLDFSSES